MGVLKFVKGKNRSLMALKRVIEYITNEEKTDVCLTYGKDCNPFTSYYEMVQTKIDFHKESGVQYKHLIQSFADYDDITPELAYEIGKQFLTHPLFDGFQVLMAVHKDKEHTHIHYAINTVNINTGKKWNQSDEDFDSIRHFSDKLCKDNGLTVIPYSRLKEKSVSDGEYRNIAKGTSWKHELWLAVSHSVRASQSREDFIKRMTKLGYKVNWTDSRKYITFETPEGKKCRNNKLYPNENFTKEKLTEAFNLNKRYADKKELENDFDLIMRAMSALFHLSDDNAIHRYPLSHLEGEALHEYLVEQEKGAGIDTEKEQDLER